MLPFLLGLEGSLIRGQRQEAMKGLEGGFSSMGARELGVTSSYLAQPAGWGI